MEPTSEQMHALDIKISLLTTKKTLHDLLKIIITQFVVSPYSPAFIPNNFGLLVKIKYILNKELQL